MIFVRIIPSVLLTEEDIKEYFIDILDEGYKVGEIKVCYGNKSDKGYWSKSKFPKTGFVPYYDISLDVNKENGGMRHMHKPEDIKTKINLYSILYNCVVNFESEKNLKILNIGDENNNFKLHFYQDIEIPSESIPNPIIETIKDSLIYSVKSNTYYSHFIQDGKISIKTIEKSENIDGIEIALKVKSTSFRKIMKVFDFELQKWNYKLIYKNRKQEDYKIWLTDFIKKKF